MDVTASFFSCGVPTLFRGSTSETAAALDPPSATSNATQATTMAGEILRT
jgi:hypothetical protein